MRLLFLILFARALSAADYYASPLATLGDGSLGDPWNINIALTNYGALSNGTLYLRGTNLGTYIANPRSTLYHCTVRSYPGEWAKVDGCSVATLVFATNAAATTFLLHGSEWFKAGQVLVMTTGEHVQLSSVVNRTNWTVNRAWNGTPALTQPAGTVGVLQDPVIKHTGSNTTFYGFEIVSSLTTNRVVGTNWWNPGGLDLDVGEDNNAINMVIHDVGHPGIGFWEQNGGILYGNIMWNVGMYDFSPSYGDGTGSARGSGVYAQNDGDMSIIANCIHFRNMTSGGKVFGETGPVINFGFFTNIMFQCDPTVDGSSGSTATSNLWYDGNLTMGTPLISYQSRSNLATYFINNYVINGSFTLKEHADSVLTNNFVMLTKGAATLASPIFYSSAFYPSNAINIVWNWNTYCRGPGASSSQFDYTASDVVSVNSAGGGILDFDDLGKGWTNWSRFDISTTYMNNWPTNYLLVRAFPNSYDAIRVHVAVINTDTNTTNATLSLTAFGYGIGQVCRLRDVQDYFNPIDIVWDGVSINLPLNRTNISTLFGAASNGILAPPSGSAARYTNEHTNVDYPGLFNAFVLERQSTFGAIGGTTVGGQSVVGGNVVVQ